MPESRAAAEPAPPLRATAEDLPPLVAAALADPAPPADLEVEVGGRRWRLATWGDPADPPFVMVHGVTSNAEAFWRVGPAISMTGRWVVAPDLPGHGRTGGWAGEHRFAAGAAALAGLLRAAKLDRPGLALLGHSWGAVLAAHLPAAGIRPRRLILLDPPTLPLDDLRALTVEPTERPYATVEEAEAMLRAQNLGWSDGDYRAKALGLTQFDAGAVLAVLTENGAWDGGLAALGDPAAAGIDTWLIRGEERTGALTLDAAVPAFATRLGADHIITIADGPHSPQRTQPEATVLAILRALGAA